MYLLTRTEWSYSGRTSKIVVGVGDSDALLHWIQFNYPDVDIDAHDFLSELAENGTVDTDNFRIGMHDQYFTVEQVDEIRG